VLFTPLVGSGAARQKEFDALRHQVQHQLQTVVPPEQIQTRVEEARTQINTFYQERLTTGAAAVSNELGKLASSNGVRLTAARYKELDSDLPGLSHVSIDAQIAGDYLAAVKFVNAVERDKMFFIVDNVNLGEQQGGQVRLAVIMETYFKSAAE
jgi:type IV pilus assembly protein PilO